VIGELYEHALAGRARPEIEHADGSRKPLPVDGWLSESPGDKSILDRCEGPTLDIGSGPGRLTVALAERGIPALGIDITPYAVDLARSSGALVMQRDVFDRVPGTGRWTTVLLADGNIGIGGDPAALLRRVAELLAPQGRALVELEPLAAAPRAGPAVPRGVGQRVVPLGLRRRRSHHRRGVRRRARPGRDLDGRRTVVCLHRRRPSLFRTNSRHAVKECLQPGSRMTLPPR
jgi:SAM-dependent methyltransferase